MTMTRTSYQSIDLKSAARVFLGRGKASSVEAVNGTTITRVQDGALDVFCIAGPTVLEGIEIPVHNIASCVRVRGDVAVVAKGGRGTKPGATDA